MIVHKREVLVVEPDGFLVYTRCYACPESSSLVWDDVNCAECLESEGLIEIR